jgi:sensor histidine kinase YesM
MYFGLPNHNRYVYSQAKTGFVILGSGAILKILMLFCIYASACYIFIYALLPQLIKSQWVRATTNVLLLCLVLFSAAWVMYWNIFPLIDSRYGTYKANDYFARFWPAVYLGIINTGKVVAAAAIIKYVKYWWLKNEEKQKLEREKMNTELQLLKAQIHPDFLFKTLSTINDYAKNNSPRTSPMLVKLSDLLSYMLYECDTPLVPLDKEIEMMNRYMEMARIEYPVSFEMELTVRRG